LARKKVEEIHEDISFVSQISFENGMSSLTLPHNFIEVWKLDGIHPELQDDVKVEDHAFSSRASLILCLTKNVIIIILWHFMVERVAFLCHIR
jgi:hypothetical protein